MATSTTGSVQKPINIRKWVEDHIDDLLEKGNFPSSEADEHRKVQRQADAYSPEELGDILDKYGYPRPEALVESLEGPRGGYAITDLGRSLEPIVAAIARWYTRHGKQALQIGVQPSRMHNLKSLRPAVSMGGCRSEPTRSLGFRSV